MSTPADNLSRLLAIRAAALRESSMQWGWLVEGIDAFLSGEKKTLCAALGLRMPGRNSAKWENARAARDAALREAFVRLPDTSSISARVGQLAIHVRRFETTTWPRVKSEIQPPERLTALQACLFHAFRAGINVPYSANALRGIVVQSCDQMAGIDCTQIAV